jgi:DNA repair protein RecO (recombination protein O)
MPTNRRSRSYSARRFNPVCGCVVSVTIARGAVDPPRAAKKFALTINVQSTAAILLRKRKFSDTSLIVSWCTESLGCIQTVAKGARRAKSPFAGRLDLFFEAEIQIAPSRKSNLHTLTEVALRKAFSGIRTDYLRMQTAAYFVELIEICTERDHRDPELFALLRRAFGYLDANNPNARAVTHFETELARIAGVHDVRRLKANPAFALGNLFGRLPLSRTPLLKALVPKKDTKPKLRTDV